MPMSSPNLHSLIHNKFNLFDRFIYGTPNWFKFSLLSGGSKVYSASNNESGSW
jgi:hypothetical protein